MWIFRTIQEDNKRKVIYFFDEVVGQGNKDAVNALLAPNCRYYDAGKVKTTNVSVLRDSELIRILTGRRSRSIPVLLHQGKNLKFFLHVIKNVPKFVLL